MYNNGMRIAIATAVYYPQLNGVAVFAHNLAVGLAKRGHEVLVICPSQTGKNYVGMEEGVKVARLRSVDAKVYPDQIHDIPEKKRILGRGLPRLWYRHGFRVSVFPQREVRRVLDEFMPEVVHVQVSDPIGLSVVSYARRHHIPVVTTEHNQPEVLTEPLRVPGLIKKPIDGLLSAYFRNRQSKSDFVTMPTERAIRDLIGKGEDFAVPVAAISNGVDLRYFKPGKAKSELYDKYGLDEKAPVVLYVGRLDPEKKVGTAIEAFLRANVKDAVFVIVGDGVDKARLEKKYSKNLDKLRFLGRILPPELYEIYQIGWVFVTASEIETQGIVLIEAAATGLPLIAVDKGAVAEVCHSGENGFLCEPGDTGAMSEAIAKILSDKKLREKFSKKSLAIAGEHDLEKVLGKFENIYQKVIQTQN